jgi:hypothetical protein
MRLLSEATSRVASENFSRKFVSLGRIVKSWDEIMGAKFAQKALPKRIVYRKPTGKRENPDAILEIVANPADATVLHYQTEVILQRMEHVFGERWITGIKFVPQTACFNSKANAKKVRPLLTQEQKNHLSKMLDGVCDPDIQNRLLALGEGILRRE